MKIKRKLILDVSYWRYYLQDKGSIDAEFPAICKDFLSLGSMVNEEQFICDSKSSILGRVPSIHKFVERKPLDITPRTGDLLFPPISLSTENRSSYQSSVAPLALMELIID